MDKLHSVSDYLLEHETMDGETFRRMMDEPELPEPAE